MTSIFFKNIRALSSEGISATSLRIEKGTITALDERPGQDDVVVDGKDGLLIPGLINAHDHLEFNTIRRLKFRDSYDHSTEWFSDFSERMDTDPEIIAHKKIPLGDRLFIGGMKNLLGGVTTVCHHNDLYPPLKDHKFPVRVVQDYSYCHSIHLDDPRARYKQVDPAKPWIIHLAEGIDRSAEMEFDKLHAWNLIRPNTVLVHGVGLNEKQRECLRDEGGGLIWCPGSNDFLFGKTATVGDLARARKLALGTDSRLSGEFDMFAELRKAQATGQIEDRQLFHAVTRDAAAMLRLHDRGVIETGAQADLVLLPPPDGDPYSSLLRTHRSRILLVMIEGKPRVGSPSHAGLFHACGVKVSSSRIDGEEKLLWAPLAKRHNRCPVQEPGVETRQGLQA